jgi:hypothetical protein
MITAMERSSVSMDLPVFAEGSSKAERAIPEHLGRMAARLVSVFDSRRGFRSLGD